jgi:redox-sensitive bicupin YhaK (pirin superfamily)
MITGELEHWDTLGNVARAKPGQVQHMWCGKSIWHTEKCVSDKPARYMQIWINQDTKNTDPYYELYNRETTEFSKLNIKMNTTMQVFAGILNNEYVTSKSYLYVISGKCLISDQSLYEGDGAELDGETIVPINSPHLILFAI